MSDVDFFNLNELFLNLGAINTPAELQGMLCGRLCGGQNFEYDEWEKLALEFMDIEHVQLTKEQADNIATLYSQTEDLLNDVNFGFSPLLPSDDATITRRTQELAAWCQGYLNGLGSSGLSGESKMSADVTDAVRDLAQISQVDSEDDDAIEEKEVYWQELVEYLKVAVLTIYTELSTKKDDSQDNSDRVVH